MTEKSWYFTIGALFFFIGLVKHIYNISIYVFTYTKDIPKIELLSGMNGMTIGIGLMVFGIGKIFLQSYSEIKKH